MNQLRLLFWTVVLGLSPMMANALDMRCQSQVGQSGPQTTCECVESKAVPILVGHIETGYRQVYQTMTESVDCPRAMVEQAHDEFISSQLAPQLDLSSSVDFVYRASDSGRDNDTTHSGIWQSQIAAQVTSGLIGIWNTPKRATTRELMQHMRERTPIPDELIRQVQDWRAQQRDLDRELTKIEKERLKMMEEMSSFLQGLNENPVLPMHLRPTPLPAGVSSERAMEPLKELHKALDQQDVIQGAREVNKLLKKIAVNKRLSHERDLTSFLEDELKRKLINSSGILDGLPFSATPVKTFRSSAWSARGVELATTTNKLLAAQSTLSKSLKHHCAEGSCRNDKRALLSDQKLYERSKTLMRALSLSDSLNNMGQDTQALEKQVKAEIEQLESLALKKNPEEALYQYLESISDYQHKLMSELQQLDYEGMFSFSRTLEFKEDRAYLLNTTKKDQLLTQSAKISECATSLQLCRDVDKLLEQGEPLLTNSAGDEVIESKVYRGLKRTLKRKSSQLESYKKGDFKIAGAAPVSMGLLDQANEAFSQLSVGVAENFEEISVAVADVGLGLVPGVGLAKDAYEVITGSHLITGEKLSKNERMIVGASVLTLGLGSSVKGLAKGIYKVSQKLGGGLSRGVINSGEKVVVSARKLGLKAKEEILASCVFLKRTLGNNIGAAGDIEKILTKNSPLIKGWRKNHIIKSVVDSDIVNSKFIARGWEAPFQKGTKVIEFSPKSTDNFVRVIGDGSIAEGRWVMKKDAIKGLSPKQIQAKYSLPGTPTHIVDVTVNKSPQMMRGKVAKNFGGNEGAVQYLISDETLSNIRYSTPTLIDGVIK